MAYGNDGVLQDVSLRDREYRLEYVKWIKSLPAEDRAKAIANSVDRPDFDNGKVCSNSYGIDPSEMRQASAECDPIDKMEPVEDESAVWIDFKAFGNLQARIYAWRSQARDVVNWGYRGWVEVYVMRPDLIQGQTLEMFGDETNVTRQAIDKLVSEFRALTGMRGRNMRSNETRLKCQRSHLK